ncbi:TPA: LysR family transcriptional regulator [Vibrio vulnificus]|nr:LysR family transcriptional regulator [Vibrio vulnificus]HDY7673904.1 LysR family transcriptional regulator [Vibrio vulnificus]HDY8097309.1 LysR family transcriptional regulator [Vibrio vulnificus]
MKERMPPLQGLYYFYVACQTGSFKLAAEQLFVSAAAVSQQIRQLEESLNIPLFIRQHRKVTLTPEGKVLFEQAQKGFAHLQEGVRLISSDANPNQLSVSTLPSFAQHWLVPRLTAFKKQQNEISLLLEPTNQLVTFEGSKIDLSIRYGRGKYPNIETKWLMDDLVYPVCHPIYAQQHHLHDLNDITRADLIEDTWPDMDWETFMRSVGLTGGHSTIQYDGSHFVLEGALAVQGVALVKHSLAARYIQEGKLVRIGDIAMKTRYSYYICAPSSYFQRKKVKLFHQWLLMEIEGFQNTYPVTGELVEEK